jgi:hypothetical protein
VAVRSGLLERWFVTGTVFAPVAAGLWLLVNADQRCVFKTS